MGLERSNTVSLRMDLRSWLDAVERLGELKQLYGADWDREIGTLVELNAKARGAALLFDQIKDYAPGFRILAGSMSSARRLNLTLGFPTDLDGLDLIRFMKDRMHQWHASVEDYPAMEVPDGVIHENTDEHEQVDLLKFPAPLWHEEDGGRYIGTGAVAIMRDPETGWINLGTYRVMVHDRASTGLFIAPRHHGRVIMEKYWKMNEPCPIVISAGHHPVFLYVGSLAIPVGLSEYNYIGSILGEQVKVVRGRMTGLPIPAFSEVSLEGFIHPGDLKTEGNSVNGRATTSVTPKLSPWCE